MLNTRVNKCDRYAYIYGVPGLELENMSGCLYRLDLLSSSPLPARHILAIVHRTGPDYTARRPLA